MQEDHAGWACPSFFKDLGRSEGTRVVSLSLLPVGLTLQRWSACFLYSVRKSDDHCCGADACSGISGNILKHKDLLSSRKAVQLLVAAGGSV